jgi:hypothetical protein
MRSVWGPVTEIRDLGVVAEHCPFCERVTPCLLRSVGHGHYVLFVKVLAPARESSCLCTGCLKAFPSEQWRYADVVSLRDAATLPLDEVLARTNPAMVERLQLKEQIAAMGGDAAFAKAYEQLDDIRPGPLRSRLLRQLLEWNRMPHEQRSELEREIEARLRAWRFARRIAPAFPTNSGCLMVALPALVIWSTFLWAPPVRNLTWGSVLFFAGLGAAALVKYLLLHRRVCQWTRNTLVCEADEANVSIECFLAVVDDLPDSPVHMMEPIWPIRVELETIRGVLAAAGKL